MIQKITEGEAQQIYDNHLKYLWSQLGTLSGENKQSIIGGGKKKKKKKKKKNHLTSVVLFITLNHNPSQRPEATRASTVIKLDESSITKKS